MHSGVCPQAPTNALVPQERWAGPWVPATVLCGPGALSRGSHLSDEELPAGSFSGAHTLGSITIFSPDCAYAEWHTVCLEEVFEGLGLRFRGLWQYGAGV